MISCRRAAAARHPITNDPPRHQNARRALLPAFTPAAVERLVPRTREICNELIDAILARDDGRSDAALDYAQHVPVRVMASLLGVPHSDGDRFRDWILQVVRRRTYDDHDSPCTCPTHITSMRHNSPMMILGSRWRLA